MKVHSDVAGIMDLDHNGNRVGCADLHETLINRVKPKLHVFGHVHDGKPQLLLKMSYILCNKFNPQPYSPEMYPYVNRQSLHLSYTLIISWHICHLGAPCLSPTQVHCNIVLCGWVQTASLAHMSSDQRRMNTGGLVYHSGHNKDPCAANFENPLATVVGRKADLR